MLQKREGKAGCLVSPSIFKHTSLGRGGVEPPKAEPTDLQSVPFDHSGTSPE